MYLGLEVDLIAAPNYGIYQFYHSLVVPAKFFYDFEKNLNDMAGGISRHLVSYQLMVQDPPSGSSYLITGRLSI